MNVKSRHHLRADAIDAIEAALRTNLAVELDADTYERVEFDRQVRPERRLDGVDGVRAEVVAGLHVHVR